MKIEKIKKVDKNKYQLQLSNDEAIITYDEVILKNNLLFKPQIDSNLLNQINIDTRYYDIYNRVIKLISTRLRSKKEIKEYLNKLNISIEDQEKIINQLTKIGLINDINFTKAYINDRTYLSNDGPNKIKKDLEEHDIDINIIEQEITNINQEIIYEKLKKLINKKIKNNRKYSIYQLKQKIVLDLINLGYDKDMILGCLNNQKLDNNDILEKQYNKLYTKFSKKYTGNELYKRIKQSLYQKGFNIEEINNLIEQKIEGM
ncbi:MAG: hypothetical protein GX247_04350 [Mollicutes bacterium]|nr:hypothetical protein [Mollicutes bacterium]